MIKSAQLQLLFKPNMLQEKIVYSPSQECAPSNKEIKEYIKANHSLRKKLKEKESKIQQLFAHIQETAKVFPPNLDTNIAKNYSISDRNNKITLTQNRRKQKQNKNNENPQELNIFKHSSINTIHRTNKEDLRLPSLEKKAKNIFTVEQPVQNLEKRAKIVRIPLQRLKPIDSEAIKKRFLMKYPRLESSND